MAIQLEPVRTPCDSCGGTNDTQVLLVGIPAQTPCGVVLCAECRIRAEAVLRSSRKNGGTVVRNWTPKGEQA